MACATGTLLVGAATGLLLKARILNERGDGVEQFAFSDLTINAPDRSRRW